MAQAQHTEVVLERKQAQLVIGKPQLVQRIQQVLHRLPLGKSLEQRIALRRLVLDRLVAGLELVFEQLFRLELELFELEQLFKLAVIGQLFKLELERKLGPIVMAERIEVRLRQVLLLLLLAIERLFEELFFVERLMAKHLLLERMI